MGGWPTAVADRLCAGCDLLVEPCCRGLSLPRRRDWAAFAALLAVSSRIRSDCDDEAAAVVDEGARVDEVRGGGMGAAAMDVAVLFMVGVARVELCDAAGEW